MKNSDVSVVVCAYTEARWDDLVAAVNSVLCQTILPRDIIVVIDHNPRLLERASVHLPGVKIVENSGPQGLADGRNSGIAASQGRIVAFLDDDAIAESDWLAQLVKGYRDGNVVGVGGMIEPIWPEEQPGWFPEEFYWVIGCTYRGMPQATAPVRNLIGCNMSFRRDLLEEIGGFRSGVGRVGAKPVGCEETEFCIRALQQKPGSVILYEPRARVFHQVTPSRGRWTYFRKRCYGEGLSKALISKSVGAKDGLASERSHIIRTLPRGVIQGVADTMLRGDLAGLARAGVIVAGLTLTIAGYLVGTLSTWNRVKKNNLASYSEEKPHRREERRLSDL